MNFLVSKIEEFGGTYRLYLDDALTGLPVGEAAHSMRLSRRYGTGVTTQDVGGQRKSQGREGRWRGLMCLGDVAPSPAESEGQLGPEVFIVTEFLLPMTSRCWEQFCRICKAGRL